jgi:hypothetical protein
MTEEGFQGLKRIPAEFLELSNKFSMQNTESALRYFKLQHKTTNIAIAYALERDSLAEGAYARCQLLPGRVWISD